MSESIPGTVARNLRKADFGGSSEEIDLSDRPVEAALTEANIVTSEALNTIALHYPVLDLYTAVRLPWIKKGDPK